MRLTLPDILRLLKRQFIAVLIVLAVAGGTWYKLETATPTYIESATIVFNPPGAHDGKLPDITAGSLIASVYVVLESLMSPKSDHQIHAFGGTGDFSASLVNFNTLFVPLYIYPDIALTASSDNMISTSRTFQSVITEVRDVLQSRQVAAGVPMAGRIGIQVIGDTGSYVDSGSNKRVDAGLIMLAVIFTLMISQFLDRRELRLLPRFKRHIRVA